VKILIANAAQSSGGAARAMQRIAAALRDAGASVEIAVLHGDGVKAQRAPGLLNRIPILDKALDRLPVLAYPNGTKLFRSLNFSPAWRTGDCAEFLNGFDADVINLHWVNYGFLSPEGIGKLRAPVVWTLHDMWPLTGGCHYAGDCTRYQSGCGTCPVLGSTSADDVSHALWLRKNAAWADKPFSIVTPSHWLADCARSEGSLFANRPVSVIANPIDIGAYVPGDRLAARRHFGLPEDAPVIAFGGTHAVQNPVKGFALLQEALRKLGRTDIHLAVFGSGEDVRSTIALDMPVHLLGSLKGDAELAAIYRAADVFTLPSLQDNLPNTVAEALSCGTPVTAFRIGGVPDMVQDGINGVLAQPFDTADLARALASCLEASRSGAAFHDAARRHAESMFDARKIARAYLDAFEAAKSGKASLRPAY
jgi:glycosyltransferase involved in cell wall biosynthesis